MRVAVFGGSGRTGSAFVAGACARDWTVVAHVRRASSWRPPGAVRMVRGDLDDATIVDETLAGADAVLCLLGPRAPYAEAFCAMATAAILAGMARRGVPRLLCLTGAMIGHLPGNVSWPLRLMAALFRRQRPAVARDRALQEALVRATSITWTLVKPPRLTDGPPTGRHAAGPALGVSLLDRIAREDLARFLLTETAAPRFERHAVYVKHGSAAARVP